VRLHWIVAALTLVGAALVVTGVVVGPAALGIEGAYFTRAAGTPAYEGVFTDWSSGDALLSVQDGNLFLGGGIACLLIASGALVAQQAGFRLVRADAPQ
jgi:hypothetical protein